MLVYISMAKTSSNPNQPLLPFPIMDGPLKGYSIEGKVEYGEKIVIHSPSGKSYKMDLKKDGRVLCTCPHAKFRAMTCKHVKSVQAMLPDPPKRTPRAEVEAIVKALLPLFKDDWKHFAVCGSYRRELPDCKDIDVVVVGDPLATMETVKGVGKVVVGLDREEMEKKIKEGKNTFLIRFIPNGESIMMDLTFIPELEFGACVLYRTGSKNFNIKCRAIAKKRGLRLNEHGLFNGDELLDATEHGIIRALGFGFVEPRDR